MMDLGQRGDAQKRFPDFAVRGVVGDMPPLPNEGPMPPILMLLLNDIADRLWSAVNTLWYSLARRGHSRAASSTPSGWSEYDGFETRKRRPGFLRRVFSTNQFQGGAFDP